MAAGEVDARFSPFRPDSEVSRLERGEDAARVSAELAEVLGLCEEYRVADRRKPSDVRLPGAGPGPLRGGQGLVGAAGGRAAAGRGGTGGSPSPNAGGDVIAAGGPWKVGVRHPEQAGRLCTVLRLTDGAVATSARYERGDHIVDGRTGRPGDPDCWTSPSWRRPLRGGRGRHGGVRDGRRGRRVGAAREGARGVRAVDAERRVLRTAGLPVAARGGGPGGVSHGLMGPQHPGRLDSPGNDP